MNAGELDRRITLQRLNQTDDGFGTVTNGWNTIATVWAQSLPVSRMVMERLAAGENSSVSPVLFKIRYSATWSDLNAKDRLIWEGRAHDITFVRRDGREFMLIDAVARGDG